MNIVPFEDKLLHMARLEELLKSKSVVNKIQGVEKKVKEEFKKDVRN